MAAVIPAHIAADRERVRSLQMALNEKNKCSPALKVDGDFGGKSITQLSAFQFNNQLHVSGIYDEATQALLEPFIAEKYLTEQDYVLAAAALGVPVAAVKTVVEVEAGGDGFLPSGDCDILFERHQFYKALLKKRPLADVQKLFELKPDIVNPKAGGYLGNQAEHSRLTEAMRIDSVAAIASASWGMFQIMGFNFAACGYASVEVFVADMKKNERNHLNAFVKFIKADKVLLMALRAQDWKAFAARYNGPAYAINKYDLKLAAAFKLFTKSLIQAA